MIQVNTAIAQLLEVEAIKNEVRILSFKFVFSFDLIGYCYRAW
jgi:hypothetical protein